MKRSRTLAILTALALAALLLAGCGRSEFGLSENTAKRMTVTAANADKGGFFMVGLLEVEDGEQLVISSALEKGSVKVELVGAPAEQSIETLPDMSGDAILTANVRGADSASGTVPAGSYFLRASCLERASGSVVIEVKPVE